jgi:hypothetical protein
VPIKRLQQHKSQIYKCKRWFHIRRWEFHISRSSPMFDTKISSSRNLKRRRKFQRKRFHKWRCSIWILRSIHFRHFPKIDKHKRYNYPFSSWIWICLIRWFIFTSWNEIQFRIIIMQCIALHQGIYCSKWEHGLSRKQPSIIYAKRLW